MKQEATKKSKKLIWLIAALAALLVVVGVVLAIFLLPGNEGTTEPTGPVGGRPDLYWNIDRQLYIGNAESAGLSTREPAEDGLYHIRFAYNGELVEYTFADKRLVNVIDNQDVIGLSFDADGNPVDAVDPATIATEVAKSFFVVGNKNGTLTLNSSIAMNGMQLPTPVGELTQIYDVRPDAPNPGAFAEVEPMDKVVVYANDKNETTHVYIVERQPEADIYWRVDKMYNSTTKETSRVPDENGVYTITFAKDGKHVDLYTKDKALVTDIDTKGAAYNAPKGLAVDENNFITAQMDPVVAIRGKLAGSEYHVTEMNGTQITATHLLSGKEQGKTFTVDVPEDCPIYNVCVGGSATMIGEPTEIQMYDRVIVYTDLEGKPVLIFVMYRMANTPMYWNIERKYNSTTGETAREPVNGYYVFKMTVKGKTVTLRTKDKKLASEIDSFSYFMCGLEVEGDIIKKVYKPVYVSGNDYYGAGGQRYIVDQIGTILSFNTISSANFNLSNLVLRPDVEIYDVTGYPGTKFGEPTTYQPGDMVRLVADYNDNITHIYVYARYTGKPIYFNFARKFNATLNVSTRAVAPETSPFAGYYVFDMATQGKHVTVVTKDKKVADIIDAQNAPIVALDAKKTTKFKDAEGNTIANVYEAKMAYEAITSLKFGAKQANYRRFLSLENGTMSTMIESTGVTDQWKVADDVVIYNCSTVYKKNRGEIVSSLQYWDQIQGVATKDDGTIKEIYIMKRTAPSKFYYNGSRKYNATLNETTRIPDADGYYVYDLTCEGKDGIYKTKNKDIANTIDSFNYVPFGMTVKKQSDGSYLVTQAFDATSIEGVKSVPASNYDVTKIDGKNLTVTRYLPTATNIGAKIELKLADNYKAYDVSSYAKNYGGKCKLALGDRAYFIANMDGEIEWIYIWYKNTHQKGYMSKCPHCNKTVYWQPYSGNTYSSYGADNLHLYVTDSIKKRAQANHGVVDQPESKRTEVILDLNGQTLLVSSGRNFLVYGTLSIVDTVGGGKMMGSTDTGVASGGAIMIGNPGIVNLYSGTLTENPMNVTNANGGVVYLGNGGTLNIKGGTIEGGSATSAGGNIFATGKSTLNMTGGKVAGDIYVASTDVKINVGGKSTITSGEAGGLILPDGYRLPLKKITSDTKIVADAQGVFTEESDNIEKYLENFSSSHEEYPIRVEGKALAGGIQEYCPHCDKDVYWTTYSGQTSTGHYIMFKDLTLKSQLQIGKCATSSGNPAHGKEGAKCDHTPDVVIDLNGHTITCKKVDGLAGSTGRFALVYAGLSIMDTSEAQTGKIIATNDNPTLNAGLILASTGSKINLYGGTLTAAEGVTAGVGGLINIGAGTFNMYGGKITGGTAAATLREDGFSKGGTGGNLYIGTYATVNIYGGEISNGKAISSVIESFDGETGKTTVSVGKTSAGGEARGMGGNIYNLGKLYIGTDDGTETTAVITGGEATYGGNIYAGASFSVRKTGLVEKGAAVAPFTGYTGYNGGNVYLSSGRATVNGVVANGTAYNGGNFGCSGGTRVYLDGGKIVDGKATSWAGGNYYSNNGILEMLNGAVVSGGRAYGMGGNVYAANGGELIMRDSTVTDGTSTSDHKSNVGGGNVYLAGRVPSASELTNVELYPDGYDYAKLTAENSIISNGVASKLNGGNVYAANGTKISLVNTVVEGGQAGATAGNIYLVGAKSSMEMDATSEVKNGKSLKEGTDTTYYGGGNLYIGSEATATISGKVLDGESNLYGGNILMSNGNLTLASGAVVTGGKTGFTGTSYGGNICRWNTGDMVIEAGATVTGGVDKNGDATDIYVNNAQKNDQASLVVAGTVGALRVNDAYVPTTLKGDVKIDNLYLKAGMLTLEDLTENASVGMSGRSGVFTNAIEPVEKAEDYAKCFYDVDGIMTCSAKDGKLSIAIEKYCEHCDQTVQWTVFTKDTAAATGHFVLADDVVLKNQLTIGKCSNHGTAEANCNHTMDMVVDLNGHTITAGKGATGAGADTGRFALVYGKLSIMDTSAEETGKIVAGRNEKTTITGGLILASTGSTFNLYSGSLENAGDYTAGPGGLVRSSYVFNMYGGKLVGGIANENNGGNIYSSGTVNIYGGQILNGSATAKVTEVPAQGETPATTTYENGRGGNIFCSGALNITGGTISGGQAYDGGNIFQDDEYSKIITIGKNAIVSDGKATNNGGNIYADYTITVQGKVTGGEAGQYGGNIWSDASIMVGSSTDATIATEISDGTAGETGGNIYGTWKIHVYKGSTVSGGNAKNGGNIGVGFLAGGGLLNVHGTVTGGTATNAGGNITGAGGTNINIDGGIVSNGTASNTAGNIQSNNGFVTLSNGASVTGGTATNSGGNIYHYTATAGRKLVITDSTVSGGKTTATTGFVGGGNIAVFGKGTVTGALEVTKSTISGGASGRFGGNIMANIANITLGEGAVVDGGTANGVGKSIAKFTYGNVEILAGATVQGGTASSTVYMDNGTAGTTTTMKVDGTVTVPVKLGPEKGELALEVSGAAKMSNVSLYDGLLITVGELTDGAEIKIADAKEGMVFTNPITDGKADEYAKYFKPVTGELGCGAVNGQLCFGTVAPCAHCGGENAVWLTYTRADVVNGGHWIVKEDISEKYQVNIGSCKDHGKETAACNHTVDTVIDLNGHTIAIENCTGVENSGSQGRFALVYGKLSIQDSSAEQTGKIIRNYVGSDTLNAGLILASTGSTVNLYSGTLEVAEGVVAAKGGILNIGNVFNMYGGKIVGGTAKESNGGNIFGGAYSTITISGGEILGGTATPKVTVTPENGETPASTKYEEGMGGNIYALGKLNITGGTISGGQAYDGGNIYLTSKYDQNIDATVSGGIATNNGGNIYLKNDGTMVLTVGEKAVITEGQAKIGGNIYTNYYTNIYGTVSNGKASLIGGNIRNSGTLNIGKADGSVAALVTGGEAPSAGNIYSVWKVNVYKGATVSNGVATTANGGNIYIEFDHSMKSETVGETTVKKVSAVNDSLIYGTVTGGKAESGYGGNIYKTGTSHLTIGKADGSEVVLITDGKAKTGGNIYMSNGANAVVNAAAVDYAAGGLVINKGVTVSGGVSSAAGGNIGINEGKTIIICGTVSGGVAGTNGGNITGAGSSRIVVDGGTVTGGSATSTGGNLQANNGYVYLQNNAVVSNGTAGTSGGNIYTRQTSTGREVVINGATVSGGTATAGNGGNIFVDSGADTNPSLLTVTNATISGGTALDMGGNIYVAGKTGKNGVLTVTNSTISGGTTTNTATKDSNDKTTYNGGGNIYVTYVDATFTGTTVSGGNSGRFGGNILANRGNVVLANGTVFEGGVSASVGKSICKWNTGNLEIQAGAILKTDASGNGDIYMDNSATGTTATMKISGTVEIPVNYASGNGNEAIEVSGAAKVASLKLHNGLLVTVGDLTEGAEIKMNGIAAGAVFTNVMNPVSKAADMAKYFKTVDGASATAENGALKF